MEEHSYFENCNDDDVVSWGNLLIRVSKLKQAVRESFDFDIPKALQGALQSRLTPDKQAVDANLWFSQSDNSTWEILRLGAKNWQKGKIRVRVIVEFCPDEPTIKQVSPLDDIRQTMN